MKWYEILQWFVVIYLLLVLIIFNVPEGLLFWGLLLFVTIAMQSKMFEKKSLRTEVLKPSLLTEHQALGGQK